MADYSKADGASRGAAMAGAGGAALVSRVVAQIAQLGIFLVAARILTPADFGVFALVGAATSLLWVFGAAGWREFILGWGGDDTAVNQAITYSFLSGYFLTALGVLGAAIAVLVYQAPVVAVLTLTLSATLLLSPVSHTLAAILVRRGQVASMSVVLIIAELAGLAAGVAGLLAGWNIVALGVGKLVMQAIYLAGILFLSRWPAKFVLNGGYGKQIIDFSKSILTTRIVSFFSTNASTFVISIFLGVTSVGYYRAAQRVVSAFSEMMSEPLRLVSWMVYRQAADRAERPDEIKEKLGEECSLVFPLLILCAAPVFVGAAVISEDMVAVLLGEKWLPAAPVVTILALGALVMTPSIVNEPLLTINGRVKVLPILTLINAAITIAVFLAITRFGLIAAALASFTSSTVLMISSIWVQTKYTDAPWWGAFKRTSPVYTGTVALVISVLFANYWLAGQNISMVARLGIEVLVGAVSYFGVIFLVRPSFLRTTFWL